MPHQGRRSKSSSRQHVKRCDLWRPLNALADFGHRSEKGPAGTESAGRANLLTYGYCQVVYEIVRMLMIGPIESMRNSLMRPSLVRAQT